MLKHIKDIEKDLRDRLEHVKIRKLVLQEELGNLNAEFPVLSDLLSVYDNVKYDALSEESIAVVKPVKKQRKPVGEFNYLDELIIEFLDTNAPNSYTVADLKREFDCSKELPKQTMANRMRFLLSNDKVSEDNLVKGTHRHIKYYTSVNSLYSVVRKGK